MHLSVQAFLVLLMCLPQLNFSLGTFYMSVLFIQSFNMRRGGFIYCFGVLSPSCSWTGIFPLLGCFDFFWKFFFVLLDWGGSFIPIAIDLVFLNVIYILKFLPVSFYYLIFVFVGLSFSSLLSSSSDILSFPWAVLSFSLFIHCLSYFIRNVCLWTYL